jgi:predicted ATP-dependent endonuclease of OLD family
MSRMVRTRAIVIVEGDSDRQALETLARRRGRKLEAEGVEIVAIGGAHAIRNYVQKLDGTVASIVGLVDARQEDVFRRFGIDVYVCDADLEDELIRALGLDRFEQVIEAQGELRSLRSLQKQPAQRNRTRLQQLRRFISSKSGRKALYAKAMVEALDLDEIPKPLDGVLARV